MLKLNVNNKITIELNQQSVDGETIVTTYDSKNQIENDFSISPSDLTMLLNYYRYQKENNQPIF